MSRILYFLSLITLITIPVSSRNPYDHPYRWYEKGRLKPSCMQIEQIGKRNAVSYCWFWEGMKSWFHRTSISWFPEKTKEWSLADVKAHCDNYFTCMLDTDCYKDYLLYQTLDRCTTDALNIGSMSFCTEILEEKVKKAPGDVADCVKDYLRVGPPENTTCQWVQEHGDCMLADIQKHCDSRLLPIFKEHQSLRLHNLGCDGELKFKDLEVIPTPAINNGSEVIITDKN